MRRLFTKSDHEGADLNTYWYLLPDRIKLYICVPLSLFLTLMLGYLDYKTGYELSFFIFYVFPVAIGAWFVGRAFGLFMSLFSIMVWFIADMKTGHQYSEDWIVFWNGGVRLSFFMIDTFLLTALKKRLDFEKEWARIDPLTGALNGRGFRDKLDTMFPFAARTKAPFAMAFIDLDNFKKVNDTKGHAMGDLILQRCVKTMIENLRTTDFIGRMGGDEFAIFLPATDEAGAARVLQGLREKLLEQVKQEKWGIGYSMGAVTLDPKVHDVPPYTDVIHQADDLMYIIKKSTKNDIALQGYKPA